MPGMDLLDHLLLLTRAWRRIVVLTVSSAIVAGALAWSAPLPPRPLPAPPSSPLRAKQQELREIAQLTAIIKQLSPRDTAYWSAWDRLHAAERLALAPAPPAPAPSPPPRRHLWSYSVLSAALGGLVLACITIWAQAWWRASLRTRPLAIRRAELDSPLPDARHQGGWVP